MKFGTKRAVALSGIVLAVGLIAFYFFYLRTVEILKGQIKEKLEDHAFNAADRIDRLFYERYLDLKMLASDPVITSGRSSPHQIAERLIEWQKHYTYYASLSFFDKDRIKIAGVSPVGIGEQHPLTEYMKDIAEGRDFTIGVSESRTVKDVAFYFASTVKDREGRPLGVVSARIPIESFHEMAAQAAGHYRDVKRMKMDLVNRDGLILYSNYNEKGILKEKLPEWESVKKSMTAEKTTATAISQLPEIENEVYISAREPGYLDFIGNGWLLVIRVPAKEAFAPAVEMRLIFLVIGGLALVIMSFFLHILLQRSKD